MTRMFWPAVAVAVIAMFFLIAGIGPLLLDIVLLLLAVVVAVKSRTSRQKSGGVTNAIYADLVRQFHPVEHPVERNRTRRGPALGGASDLRLRWWRGEDLNLRPSGYEPEGALPYSRCSRAVPLTRSFARRS